MRLSCQSLLVKMKVLVTTGYAQLKGQDFKKGFTEYLFDQE